jgi:hypothetical protein
MYHAGCKDVCRKRTPLGGNQNRTKRRARHAWCQKTLARFRLPETVHDEAEYRVWQRRYYAMNIFTDQKRLEKLRYMHGNPVKRGLVASPDQWQWFSFRFYHVDDASVLRMDRLD